MKVINILIVEDNPIEALLLKERLVEVGYCNITLAPTGEEAVEFIKTSSIDLALVDIELGNGMDGVQTAINFNKLASLHLIYITSLRDKNTFVRAKQTLPEFFLSKPYNLYQLIDCIDSIVEKNSSINIWSDYIFAKKAKGNTYFKISKKDIVYLEADSSYTVIHTNSNESLVLTKNLKHCLRILEKEFFIRVNRSIAINIHYVDSLQESNILTLKHYKKTIPVTATFKTNFIKLINKAKM